MIGPFAFEHGGRKYTCAAEERTAAPAGTWWWFAVSHDQQRYAPFEAAAGDTQQSVRSRIVAYYEHLQWARAQPPAPRHGFSRPGKPAAQPAAPAKT